MLFELPLISNLLLGESNQGDFTDHIMIPSLSRHTTNLLKSLHTYEPPT